MSDSHNITELPKMVDYDKVGNYDGSKPENRWLARLDYETRRMGIVQNPTDFFEAVEILFEGEAADWVDSSIRYRRMIDNRSDVIKEDMEEFRTCLQNQYPVKATRGRDDGNLQTDISCLEQGGEESLADYYGRAQELLRRSHGRDVIINGSSPLSPIEQVVLSGIISAFLGGIKEDDVRKAAMMKSMTTTRSLRAAYEAAEDTKAAITKISEMEKARAEKKELEILRRQNNQRWGQTVNSGVTSPYQSSVNHERKMNMTQTQSTRQLTTDLTHSMVGTNSGQSHRSVVPPNRLSRHPIINGTKPYSKEMGLLCFRCGELGHRKAECIGNPLEWWEQMKLKEILWPKTSSNYARISGTEAGLRYRDIEDSNWRSRDLPERIKEEAEITQKQVPFYNSDTPELTFEQYTGEITNKKERNNVQSMSVVLGFEEKKIDPHKKVRFSDKGKERKIITLESFLNVGDLRKRARPIHIEDLLNKEGQEQKMRKKDKNAEREKRHLREIVGRRGRGPIDYQKLADGIRVEVSLVDLFQISPDLSRAFRKLSTRINNPRKRRDGFSGEARGTPVEKFKNYARVESESLLGKAVAALGDHELKAFRVPVTVRTRKGRQDVNVTLPASMAQADQGSDMIIVTIGFLKKLGLPMKSLSEKGFNGLTMNVADGTSSKLSYFSEFEIGVMGIWRKVEAFVRPFSSENDEEVHLLLGMPWLHAVDAKIRIRDSIIEIGDEAQAEAIVKLQGPKFVESEIHKLILCPKEKIDARVNKTDYVESSSEDGDDESFWESEEDSDDIDLSNQENCST